MVEVVDVVLVDEEVVVARVAMFCGALLQPELTTAAASPMASSGRMSE
jgi:hypothetical protein